MYCTSSSVVFWTCLILNKSARRVKTVSCPVCKDSLKHMNWFAALNDACTNTWNWIKPLCQPGAVSLNDDTRANATPGIVQTMTVPWTPVTVVSPVGVVSHACYGYPIASQRLSVATRLWLRWRSNVVWLAEFSHKIMSFCDEQA